MNSPLTMPTLEAEFLRLRKEQTPEAALFQAFENLKVPISERTRLRAQFAEYRVENISRRLSRRESRISGRDRALPRGDRSDFQLDLD